MKPNDSSAATRTPPTVPGTSSDRFSREALDRYADEIRRDGICVIRGLFDKAIIHEWRSAFETLRAKRADQPGGLAPRGSGRFYFSLPWRAPFANEAVFANDVILSIIERVFTRSFQMVQCAVDYPTQGSSYQALHRDHQPLFGEEIVTPLYALAVNFPLCDVTEENGPLELARGTHRIPRERALREIETGDTPIERFLMSAGDVSIRTPLALHRGTPNRTEEPRPMVVMGYVMEWLRTPKVELSVPREIYNALSERAQRLLRCEVIECAANDNAVEEYLKFEY